MGFSIIEGDLFDSEETYLCHQCNCVTKKGANLSSTMFRIYPYADVYSPRAKTREADTPGTISLKGNGKDKRFIINMFGQYYPGRAGWAKQKGWYKYMPERSDGAENRIQFFVDCLNKMSQLKGSFAFPWRIGCGLAGGDWNRYLKILRNFSEDVDDVVIYKLKE